MKDSDCVAFLRWTLPRLGLEWRGFRKVRRQVCRRLSGRLRELGLGTDVDATLLERARAACYRSSSLEALPAVWREAALEPRGKLFCLRKGFRAGVELERQDLLAELPQRLPAPRSTPGRAAARFSACARRFDSPQDIGSLCVARCSLGGHHE